MTKEIHTKVQLRLKELLFNALIENYQSHEFFYTEEGDSYQFLIWKLQPCNPKEVANKVKHLIEDEGYQCIPGVCDISNFNPVEKVGFKVMAFYRPF